MDVNSIAVILQVVTWPTALGGWQEEEGNISKAVDTRWFKYDRDYLCVNKSQFVPVIFEPPCT